MCIESFLNNTFNLGDFSTNRTITVTTMLAALDDENTLLLWGSLHRQDVEALQNVIDDGIDINIPDRFGMTPLHVACHISNTHLVQVLLKADACVNAVNKSGQTCLHLASKNGNKDIVNLLLKHNCRIHSMAKYSGMTVLHEASQGGHHEIVNILLEHGANPNALDMMNKSPEHYAESDQVKEVFKNFEETNGKFPESEVSIKSSGCYKSIYPEDSPDLQEILEKYKDETHEEKSNPEHETHEEKSNLVDETHKEKINLQDETVNNDKNVINRKLKMSGKYTVKIENSMPETDIRNISIGNNKEKISENLFKIDNTHNEHDSKPIKIKGLKNFTPLGNSLELEQEVGKITDEIISMNPTHRDFTKTKHIPIIIERETRGTAIKNKVKKSRTDESMENMGDNFNSRHKLDVTSDDNNANNDSTVPTGAKNKLARESMTNDVNKEFLDIRDYLDEEAKKSSGSKLIPITVQKSGSTIKTKQKGLKSETVKLGTVSNNTLKSDKQVIGDKSDNVMNDSPKVINENPAIKSPSQDKNMLGAGEKAKNVGIHFPVEIKRTKEKDEIAGDKAKNKGTDFPVEIQRAKENDKIKHIPIMVKKNGSTLRLKQQEVTNEINTMETSHGKDDKLGSKTDYSVHGIDKDITGKLGNETIIIRELKRKSIVEKGKEAKQVKEIFTPRRPTLSKQIPVLVKEIGKDVKPEDRYQKSQSKIQHRRNSSVSSGSESGSQSSLSRGVNPKKSTKEKVILKDHPTDFSEKHKQRQKINVFERLSNKK